MNGRAGAPGSARGTERSPAALSALATGVLLVVAVLFCLGVWQVKRLAWKEDLIARVDARVHALPAPPPGPAQWLAVNAETDAYHHVVIDGTFDNTKETAVQAVTALGAGYWILTPLHTTHDGTVLVNRGFVPAERRNPASRRSSEVSGPTRVTGLLRITEPKGAFLRTNDPAGDHWFARDVAAIAVARRLTDVAPYFIDADASPGPGDGPVGGLTVIAFPNNHLVYALTWFGMAALLAGAAVWVGHDEWRRRTGREFGLPTPSS